MEVVGNTGPPPLHLSTILLTMGSVYIPSRQYGKRKRYSRASGPVKRQRTVYGVSARRPSTMELSPEIKYFDTSLVSLAITNPTGATGGEADPTTIDCLNAIAQGDGESNRDGRNCHMKSINIRGTVIVSNQINQTVGQVPTQVMLALVHDKQTNGVQLNSEDVFTNVSASAVLASCPFRNLQYTKRFTILASQLIVFEPQALSYDGTNMEASGMAKHFQMNAKLGFVTNFKGTTSVVGSIVDNSVHMIAYCTGSGTAPALSYNSRVRFSG